MIYEIFHVLGTTVTDKSENYFGIFISSQHAEQWIVWKQESQGVEYSGTEKKWYRN